jgi:arginine deiminase
LKIDINSLDKSFNYDYIHLRPLSNLTFCRDQQITTSKGVVMGKFFPIQRAAENFLLKEIWKALKVPIIGETKVPCTLEGGDFIPLKDYSLLGVGLRTNFLSAKYLMEENLIGPNMFILVEDLQDFNQ